jgi:aspartate aminotransferase
MGIYGERTGALHVVYPSQNDPKLIRNVECQLGWIQRKEVSSAGRYGATIAMTIMSDPELYAQWCEDLGTMSSRIGSVRKATREGLQRLETPGDWSHVTEQIGMFCYTGLTKEQTVLLREKHIYMAANGRAALTGLNSKNVQYFVECLSEVVKATWT